MNEFLQDYKEEAAPSDYMKLLNGANTFRVLSSAIVGWKYFTKDESGKAQSHLVKTVKEVPADLFRQKDDKPKRIWAFVVYNRSTEEIQVLEIKQKGIQDDILALVNNPKWGDPKTYDIVVNKVSTGPQPKDVEYSVMPEPKEPIDPGVVKAYEDLHINLDELYRNGNPFASTATPAETKASEEDQAESIADEADAAIG